jgi:ATP-dependent exoDNAse (exonuclease V) beta subunit
LLPAQEPGDAERLLTGSFDRVVVAQRAGVPTAALITDYKTDSVPDEAALEARTEHHRPQMQAYREALVALTGLPPSRVGCRLLFLSSDVVVDV